jgi:hypothetical protein
MERFERIRAGVSLVLRLLVCYLIASFGMALVLIAGSPGGHVPATIALLIFPVLPYWLAKGFLLMLLGQAHGSMYWSRNLALLLLFIGFFVGAWFAIQRWTVRMRLARAHKKPIASPDAGGSASRTARTERRLQDGRDAASRHLNHPEYVADYAHANGLDLDGVHALIRAGRLSTYWHEGILFVGDRRPDAAVGAIPPSVSGGA